MKHKKQPAQEPPAREAFQPGRRDFLNGIGGTAAAVWFASAAEAPVQAQDNLLNHSTEVNGDFGGVTGAARAEKVYAARVQAATFQKFQPLPDHPSNGDEERYPNRLGSYSKTLPHNNLGEVDLSAYNTLMHALRTGNSDDFENVTMGGSARLKNPQAGLGMDMQGPDPMHLYQPPPPAFASAEIAAEIAENYWMALARDVHFLDYDTSAITNAAAVDLNRFSDFRGAKLSNRALPRRGSSAGFEQAAAEAPQAAELAASAAPAQRPDQGSFRIPQRAKAMAGRVTTQTLFRGVNAGDQTGPLLSQFLWKDIPYGVQTISQKMRTPIPGDDYLTNYSDWLFTQNSRGDRNLPNQYDPTHRYIRNARDLGEWVHIDVLFQAYFNAMLILLGMGAPSDKNNPYEKSRTQYAFGTFGPPHIATLVCEVATRALKAVWFQKWFVHRRLRPEVFAGRVHNHVTRAAIYPINEEILNSAAVTEVQRKHGTALLPMAFAEGSPSHPAYGAGHATVAGACVTILKAWFDESYVIPDPVVSSADGLSLLPYNGTASLTVGGELNKLASNVALGRNMAGVHWRSDATESLKLGEAVAIGILQDYKACYNEKFDGFSLTKFDGTRITVG
jgi:hypothetical protein